MAEYRHTADNILSDEGIEGYRRDGFLVVRGLLPESRVNACLAALSDLAAGRVDTRDTRVQFENSMPPDTPDDQREAYVRRYMHFVADVPELGSVAMDATLNAILDQLLGRGRQLVLEMAMVKPARVGSEKPWHQDAAYFRIADPALVVGIWIALDPATLENGCMEVLCGSHLDGPVAHFHENDLNLCRILPDMHSGHVRIPIEMAPGDALIFHSLLQHYTAPNRSPHSRRAIQFHYAQSGAVFCTAEQHRRVYHDGAGNYTGCTVLHPHLPGGDVPFPDPLVRKIEPVRYGA